MLLAHEILSSLEPWSPCSANLILICDFWMLFNLLILGFRAPSWIDELWRLVRDKQRYYPVAMLFGGSSKRGYNAHRPIKRRALRGILVGLGRFILYAKNTKWALKLFPV